MKVKLSDICVRCNDIEAATDAAQTKSKACLVDHLAAGGVALNGPLRLTSAAGGVCGEALR